jgi:hypothetical protein
MELTIKHGISKNEFFLIAQPKRRYEESRLGADKPIITLEDPKTGNPIKTELYEYWTATSEQFEEMNALALLAYGWPAKQLKQHLVNKYPELNENFVVEYWLLKRL